MAGLSSDYNPFENGMFIRGRKVPAHVKLNKVSNEIYFNGVKANAHAYYNENTGILAFDGRPLNGEVTMAVVEPPAPLPLDNLFDGVWESGGFRDGVLIVDEATIRSAHAISVEPNTTYVFTVNGASNRIIALVLDSSGKALPGSATGVGYQSADGTIKTPENAASMYIRCYQDDVSMIEAANCELALCIPEA